jgi:hypothetical protein
MTNPKLDGGDEESDPVPAGSPLVKKHKVVAKLRSGEVVKGYFILPCAADMRDLSNQGQNGSITISSLTSNEPLQVALSDIKAVFFVKSFWGDPKRKGLRFYTNGPSVGAIWAEIRFQDDEIIEAMIDNSAQHLMGDCFLLRPSDAESNNLLVYVNKSAIATYRVLGVRAHFEPDEIGGEN